MTVLLHSMFQILMYFSKYKSLEKLQSQAARLLNLINGQFSALKGDFLCLSQILYYYLL